MNIRRLWRQYRVQWSVGLVITWGFIFIHLFTLTPTSQHGAPLKRLEGLGYDLRLKYLINWQPERNFLPIVIVDIDEKSLQALGRFPWSRHVMAKMQTNLAAAGAAVVAYDVLFSEPELNPAIQTQQALKQLNEDEQIQHRLLELAEQLDADTAFADSLTATDTVLGVLFEHKAELKRGHLAASHFEHRKDFSQLPVPEFQGYIASINKLKAPGYGFINSAPEIDGFLRYAMLATKYQDHLYPALALEAARLYTLADDIQVISQPFGSTMSIQGFKVGETLIATDDYGRISIPFRGPAFSFPYVSAVDVINQQIELSLFDQAIVLIGTSAVGHADLRTTPVGVQYPGVEVHANVLEGIVFPELIPSRPDWIDGAVVVLLLLLGLMLTCLLPMLGLLGISVTLLLLSAAFICASSYAWAIWKLDLPQLAVLALLFTQTCVIAGLNFLRAQQGKEQIKSIFDQYVPPAHIQAMLEEPNSINLEGEKREITVLFADIRSFTAISESLSAEKLKIFLNEYFSPITKIIFEHQGTIDKYVGDMVMAFWNAPLQVKAHPQLAVECSLKMLEEVKRLSTQLQARELPAFKIGIGLNTGEMNVGDMGSEYRRAYTVLGDAVNLGSRLESLTKFYGVGLLISETTHQQCPAILCRPIDNVKVKGKRVAVSIYEPLDKVSSCNEQVIAELQLHRRALQYYLGQQWDDAEALFRQLKTEFADRKVYQIFLQRIAEFKVSPPGENWDGSYAHQSK